MALLSDADLMPWWVREGFETPPWQSDDPAPEIPCWLLDLPVADQEPGCDCGCTHNPGPVATEEPVRWAVPGVWPDEPAEDRPAVGVLVAQLQDAVGRLERLEPGTLPGGRALAEAEAILDLQRRLRVVQLARGEDVRARKLFEQAGFRSCKAWYRTVAPDAPTSDPALARKLPRWAHLQAAVQAGTVSLAGADKVSSTMRKVTPYLDSQDGLIDGRPGEEVVTAVVGNVIDLVCRDRFGLEPDPGVDPARAALLAQLETDVARIQDGGGAQQDRVEQAMVLLARYVHPSRLAGPLEQLELSLVPSVLEEREKTAQDKRDLALTPRPDGMWDVRGTLTPEVGELLVTALAAEARRDPANPLDTAARAQGRADQAAAAGGDGWADAAAPDRWEHNPDLLSADGDRLVPRSRSKRLHDALGRLLTRYLEGGLGGLHGKVPVQVSAIISERTIHGAPGAPPARGGSGRPLARSLLRRWWCDAHVTTLLMSRGWTPVGIVHTGRTVTGTELKAVRVQHDNRCPGIDCCPSEPDPLVPLIPHHVRQHAVHGTTSVSETLLVCDRLHADIHTGKRTIRLRDGRLITEEGWLVEHG